MSDFTFSVIIFAAIFIVLGIQLMIDHQTDKRITALENLQPSTQQ